MMRLELSIAWRYLRSRSGSRLLNFISVIAIGGVIVGVSALIVITGVMTGLQNDLRDKILIGSPDIRIVNFGADLRLTDSQWHRAMAVAKKTPGVVAAAPFVLQTGASTNGHDAVPVQVQGIESRVVPGAQVTTIREQVISGDFRFASSDGAGRGVVLGKRLAERLGVYVGSPIAILSTAGVTMSPTTGTFAPPQVRRYEVTGIFETGMYEYDNTYVYMALEPAKEFAALGDNVTGVEVRTTDRWAAKEIGARIGEQLGMQYRILDWQEQNSALFSALKLEKLGMAIILLLIIVVAAFNIVSTLTMVVRDKTREIGILRAMGMRARSIRRVFFAQGLFIGLVGTGLGLLLGVIAGVGIDRGKFINLNPEVYFIDHLPVRLQISDVLSILLASVAISALATLYPAIQAARLYPVEAIRKE